VSEDFRFSVSRLDDVSSHLDTHMSTVPSVWTMCHTVWTPDKLSIIRSDDVHFRLDPPLVREVSVQLASVWMTQQPVWTPLYTRSASVSFHSNKGKIYQTVQTMWYPVWTHVSLRQESQFKYTHLDARQLWSGHVFIK